MLQAFEKVNLGFRVQRQLFRFLEELNKFLGSSLLFFHISLIIKMSEEIKLETKKPIPTLYVRNLNDRIKPEGK